MVLLSSSTVSVIVSTSVICLFTLLLFLSGYVLQQQSVRSIQHALRPPDPGHGSARSPYQASEPGILSDLVSDQQHQRVYKSNYAYLQLLSTPDPSNICSAILFFKHLAANHSAIQDRLFMYPQEWDLIAPQNLPKPIARALSLLRSASLQYGVWLLPIDMSPATAAGSKPTDSKLLSLGQIQFMNYDSVLYVHTPGLLTDSAKLDAMLLDRPLPLRHDKSRPESFNNEAWIPMPLRADRDPHLPPVYLITVNNIGGGHVEARGHVPNFALPGFGGLVGGPRVAEEELAGDGRGNEGDGMPGYVYFEHDRDGHVRWAKNPLFGAWRAKQSEVCEGVELDWSGYNNGYNDDHDDVFYDDLDL